MWYYWIIGIFLHLVFAALAVYFGVKDWTHDFDVTKNDFIGLIVISVVFGFSAFVGILISYIVTLWEDKNDGSSVMFKSRK